MPDIMVQRGAGNSQGVDIIDALLTTVEACTTRGKAALDASVSGLQPITLEVMHRQGVLPGDSVEVGDTFMGGVWYGGIVGVRHTIDGPALTTKLTVHRPTLFEV